MITTLKRTGLRCRTLNKLPIWNLVPYILIRQLRQSSSHQAALEEQYQKVQHMKKLQGQQGALSKTKSSPESQHERSLLRNMESDKEIIQYLKESSSQDTSLYAAAVKRCSELKCPNSIIRIIKIVQSKIFIQIAYFTICFYIIYVFGINLIYKTLFSTNGFEEQQHQSKSSIVNSWHHYI
ncbi:hypothetical protein RFI_31825 [Reticulomyxa filosa]|uniref:Uncharacterized protein n=1 Tax=Reticulomyxa filosa TaxID=46433 RepID=X6LW18_RETFI|nr:hypothetical protein RFI_31825 [Reticulomyxa filosa]|eukprot:ETO05571.1 hypothetical protein RFI_31825 [Reticulomyxa filosa]